METDFTFRNEGSLVILTAVSMDARTWVCEELPDTIQTWGPSSVVIEWRYFPEILVGLQNDGLSIREV